ncbi:hypothetical protein JHK87_016423 [Glycine soja]|nr:hypothetical protein JHK87_016423 [Glycine soja]
MRTYDVFVCFRAETRNDFNGFLFKALRRKDIDAFKDDKDIRKGESIAPELLQAIAGTRVFVVSGCYEIAFAKYAERLKEDKENMDEMQRWREALTRVASVSGYRVPR